VTVLRRARFESPAGSSRTSRDLASSLRGSEPRELPTQTARDRGLADRHSQGPPDVVERPQEKSPWLGQRLAFPSGVPATGNIHSKQKYNAARVDKRGPVPNLFFEIVSRRQSTKRLKACQIEIAAGVESHAIGYAPLKIVNPRLVTNHQPKLRSIAGSRLDLTRIHCLI
jgi:hypothetical protein